MPGSSGRFLNRRMLLSCFLPEEAQNCFLKRPELVSKRGKGYFSRSSRDEGWFYSFIFVSRWKGGAAPALSESGTRGLSAAGRPGSPARRGAATGRGRSRDARCGEPGPRRRRHLTALRERPAAASAERLRPSPAAVRPRAGAAPLRQRAAGASPPGDGRGARRGAGRSRRAPPRHRGAAAPVPPPPGPGCARGAPRARVRVPSAGIGCRPGRGACSRGPAGPQTERGWADGCGAALLRPQPRAATLPGSGGRLPLRRCTGEGRDGKERKEGSKEARGCPSPVKESAPVRSYLPETRRGTRAARPAAAAGKCSSLFLACAPRSWALRSAAAGGPGALPARCAAPPPAPLLRSSPRAGVAAVREAASLLSRFFPFSHAPEEEARFCISLRRERGKVSLIQKLLCAVRLGEERLKGRGAAGGRAPNGDRNRCPPLRLAAAGSSADSGVALLAAYERGTAPCLVGSPARSRSEPTRAVRVPRRHRAPNPSPAARSPGLAAPAPRCAAHLVGCLWVLL